MHKTTLAILSALLAFNAAAHAESSGDSPKPLVTTSGTNDRIWPADGDSTVGCGCGCGCGPCQYYRPQLHLSGGYLYLAREHYRNSPIVTSTNTGDTILDTSDVEGDFESGFEVRGRWADFEVRYLRITSEDNFRIPASGASRIRYMGDDYFSTLVLDHETELQSAEVNLLCSNPCENVRLSYGFRYLQLEEDLAASFPGFTGSIFTSTHNDLYGLQLGVEVDLWTTAQRCCSLVCAYKAGVFYADSNLDIFPNAAGVALLGSTSDSSERGAFVAELGLLMRLQVTRRMSFDAGYNLLYLSGVALVGDQPQSGDLQPGLPATSSIENGDLLFHGLMTRATFSF